MIRVAQQLAGHLCLGRGIVLSDHCLVLLDGLIALTQCIVHFASSQLRPLPQAELAIWNIGGELVLLECAFILLLSAHAFRHAECRELDVSARITASLGSLDQLLIAADRFRSLSSILH